MRKKLAAFLCCLPLLFMTAYAAEEESDFDYASHYQASGADELYGELPDETVDDLAQIGFEKGHSSPVTNLDVDALLRSVMKMTASEMRTPLSYAGILLAVLLLASLFKSGEDTLSSSLSSGAETAVSAAASVTLVLPVLSLIEQISDCVNTAGTFTQAFAPVFAGILIANGQTASAAGGGAFLLGAVELSSVCVEGLILPMLRIFLALSCVSSLSEDVQIDAIIGFFEKNAKWILSFLGVLLSASLSISGVLAASADNVAARAAKFVIAGSVPVVGGAVSDAYLSIKSGMALLRNSVGAFGIVAVAYLFLPVIIRTALWRFVAEMGLSVSETLGLGSLKKLMRSLSGMLSLMLGVTVFSLFLLTLGSIIVILQKTA